VSLRAKTVCNPGSETAFAQTNVAGGTKLLPLAALDHMLEEADRAELAETERWQLRQEGSIDSESRSPARAARSARRGSQRRSLDPDQSDFGHEIAAPMPVMPKPRSSLMDGPSARWHHMM